MTVGSSDLYHSQRHTAAPQGDEGILLRLKVVTEDIVREVEDTKPEDLWYLQGNMVGELIRRDSKIHEELEMADSDDAVERVAFDTSPYAVGRTGVPRGNIASRVRRGRL